jgi:hypothetical protein
MESEIEIMDTNSKGLFEKIKDWSYENWQTLLIILIVLIVGISAYNYNQNNANNNSAPAVVNSENESDENLENSDQNNEIANNLEESNLETAIENADQKEAAVEDGKTGDPVKEEIINTNTNNKEEGNVLSSSDSGKQYTETAVFGDGITHLARRALGAYIEETGDGANLSKEQKIYAEDYMQNRTGSEKIEIGHQETFSEGLIKEAISSANNLSVKALENITKYVK